MNKMYRPNRVMALMRKIKAELDRSHGRPLSFAALGRYSGESAATAFDRLHREHQPQVEGMLCLLERVPEPLQVRLLKQTLRCHPSFTDARLSHDPSQFSYLRTVVRQTNGITVIQGANAGIRTFLAVALANEARCVTRGLDAHWPDWFVGIDGVNYFNERNADKLREHCLAKWPELVLQPRKAELRTRLFIFNGVWCPVADLHQRIVQLATRVQCIIADDLQINVGNLPSGMPHPAHILTGIPDRNDRIQVKIEVR